MSDQADWQRLEALIEAADQIVAFTGAGISTESGVPDFRSADSAWKRHAPIPFADFLASEDMRVEAWRRKFAMDDLYAGAKPARGHMALARLAASGKMTHVITQNIDGLHQASGIPANRVIELHGNGTYARCLACGERHELVAMRAVIEGQGRAPVCTACGGLVKSATISFGQSMPQEEMQRARRATLACDLFLAIGSSLVVHPAAAFPVIAKENGAVLVILNRDPTPVDAHADLVLRADIGDVMDLIGRKAVDEA
jgi:NAD-dependent deacetylase